ncbi:DUF1702 family protein [Virgibacillus senegalensis]|uniref:DUF1702 family protein n=1 Tax=Virgibacillus senegalensis TaxID=1499679 RepID=UPI00069D6CB9|nr:DUF1702 family protein [Virgibacillus senegalensis]
MCDSILRFSSISFVIRGVSKALKLKYCLQTRSSRWIERYENIFYAFLSGCAYTLLKSDWSKFGQHMERKNSIFYVGFSFEGAALGLGYRLRSSLKSGEFEKMYKRLSPKYRYQYYVGLGWWLHLAFKNQAFKYFEVERKLDRLYAPILYDGIGFKLSIFKFGFYPHKLSKAVERLGVGSERSKVVYQGIGRSLWFLTHFRIEESIRKIQSFHYSIQQEILSGLGIAVAYSYLDNASTPISKAEALLDETSFVSFKQGLAFGWKARKIQDQKLYDQAISQQGIRDEVEKLVSLVDYTEEVANNYYLWVQHTRKAIKQYKEDKSVELS